MIARPSSAIYLSPPCRWRFIQVQRSSIGTERASRDASSECMSPACKATNPCVPGLTSQKTAGPSRARCAERPLLPQLRETTEEDVNVQALLAYPLLQHRMLAGVLEKPPAHLCCFGRGKSSAAENRWQRPVLPRDFPAGCSIGVCQTVCILCGM
jgi:hypothetical protein